MMQRLVIMAAGEGGARVVRSLPRPFHRGEAFPRAGVAAPRPGRPVRVPLAAMRWRTGADGTLSWDTEPGTATVAYFEISVD